MDDKSPSSTDAVLVVRNQLLCPSCRSTTVFYHPHKERPASLPEMPAHLTIVKSIEATTTGWNIKGGGRYTARCPMCGQTAEMIIKEIPVQVNSLTCPGCGKTGTWNYQIKQVSHLEEDNEFEFSAELICVSCHKKTQFKRILEKIFDIFKIEIGPTGISIGKG